MSRATVGRWGKTLAVRIPAPVARLAKFDVGAAVDVTVLDENAFIVRRIAATPTIGRLFEGRSPEQWRDAYRDAFDWGADQGREAIDE